MPTTVNKRPVPSRSDKTVRKAAQKLADSFTVLVYRDSEGRCHCRAAPDPPGPMLLEPGEKVEFWVSVKVRKDRKAAAKSAFKKARGEAEKHGIHVAGITTLEK